MWTECTKHDCTCVIGSSEFCFTILQRSPDCELFQYVLYEMAKVSLAYIVHVYILCLPVRILCRCNLFKWKVYFVVPIVIMSIV